MLLSILDRKTDNCIALITNISYLVCLKGEMTQMDVPLENQDDDFSCTPVCILMVLRYITNRYTANFPKLDLTAISEAVKTSADIGGTTFENIGNINKLFKKTSPSLEVAPRPRCKFEEIVEEIKVKHCPVIAWVLMPDPNGAYEHAIVVTDIDEDKLLIYCNDPVYGRVIIPTRQFIDMWNGCFRILIKFKIGEKVTLYDYYN
jgi:ABC-type bacteriocin/lantibiotic exporter with double-glycine peptidase domain